MAGLRRDVGVRGRVAGGAAPALLSAAWIANSRPAAGHGAADDGHTGGANALSIILAVAIVSGLAYAGWKRWRRRVAMRAGADGSHDP